MITGKWNGEMVYYYCGYDCCTATLGDGGRGRYCSCGRIWIIWREAGCIWTTGNHQGPQAGDYWLLMLFGKFRYPANRGTSCV